MDRSFGALPAEAAEPEFTAIYSLWLSRMRDGHLPSRADFDPADLPPAILKHMLLFEVDRQPARFRFKFRLAATGFTALVGREVTGIHIDELGPAERTAPVQRALEEIVRKGRPVFLASRLTLVNEDYYYVKRLGLPLAQDGAHVDMVLASFLPLKRAEEEIALKILSGALPEPDGEVRYVL